MKKNLKNIFPSIFLLLLLFSCRVEDFENSNKNTPNSLGKFLVQRLNYDELKTKAPKVIEKISSLQSNKSKKNLSQNSLGRTYIDSENGYSINTDKSVYIEDGYGNKTYTFEALMDKPDLSSFYNIVLKDMGNDTYIVSLVKYNTELLKNQTDTSAEYLKRMISVDVLGKNTGSSIFGRYSGCFFPVAIYSYVEGTPCTDPIHHSNPADCQCGTPGYNCSPPIASSYEFAYYMGFYDCEGGGGVSDGTGGDAPSGTTTPIGGGGTSTAKDPCKKLSEMLNKNISNPTPSIINEQTNNLENHLNTPNVGTKEKGINVYYTTSSNDLTVYSQESSPNDEDSQATLTFNNGWKSIFFGHDHTYFTNGEKALSIFSLMDIYMMTIMLNNGGADANTYFYITTEHGTKYYIRFDNNDFKDWMNQNKYFFGWDTNVIAVRDTYRRFKEEDYEKKVKSDNTPEENLKGFLQFFNDKDILGIDMIEVQPNGDKYKLIYGFDGTVKRTKCP